MSHRTPVMARRRVIARLHLPLFRMLAALLCITYVIAVSGQTIQHIPGTTALSGTATLSVSLQPAGTVTAVRVLTQGVANKDFTDAGGGTCAAGISSTCTVNVAFTPTAPGRRSGAVVLVGSSNQVLAQQLIDGTGTGPLAVIQPGRVELVAGNGVQPEYVTGEDGKAAISAHVYLPRGVVGTPAGDFYVADTLNQRIRHVDTHGIITTIAGLGYQSSENDGGLAKTAGVNMPAQLALDGAGNLYFADTGNNAVRRIDATSGIVTTVAGSLVSSGYAGDNGPATSALLQSPYGIAFDKDGNLYIADTGNNVVRKVDTNGTITTVAGTGTGGHVNDGHAATTAEMYQPFGLAFGPDGLLYIADKLNMAVRRLNADGTLTTVAGSLANPGFSGDGSASTIAQLNLPTSVAVDTAGNIYIADSQNNRIRRANVSTGKMETLVNIASYPATNPTGQLLNADSVSLSTPYAIALDGQNNLYITDDFFKRVLLIHSNQAKLWFPDMKVGKKAATPQILRVENDGTDAFTPSNFLYDQSALYAATTTCSTTATVAVGSSCALAVQFAPTTVSVTNSDGTTTDPVGTLSMLSPAANSPDVISMTGTVLSVEPTQVALSAVSNPSGLGDKVTFTAIVSETQGTGVPTGTVTFYDGSTAISGDVTMTTNGIATFSTTALTLGQHTINATYSGDNNNAASTATLTQTVLQTTSVLVSSSLNPAAVTQNVTFTATVSATSPVTSGTVTFYDGSSVLGTAEVGANSKATLTISTLTGGAHTIIAKFAGDTSNQGSTSATFAQTVTKAASTLVLVPTPSAITVGESVSMKASVSSPSGPAPTGTVTFKNGATTLGSGSVDANGTVTVTTTTLPAGTDSLTATYSGDGYTTGSSGNAVVLVNRLLTATTLSSDGTPSNAGSAVKLTANVSMGGGQTAVGTISGTVTFYDGANTLGSASISNGVATLSTTALTVGSHSLTARFSGNTNYDVSTSASFTQVVQTSNATVTLGLSALNVLAGKPVTLTATVTTNGVVKATGAIVFMDGATTLNTVQLNAQATATISLATLLAGSHSITATYQGDSNYAGTTSSPSALTITLGTPTLTVTSSTAHTTYSTPVTLNMALSSNGVLPSNPAVTLLDNGTPLTTATMNAAGTASYTNATLAVGTHSMTAQFAGNLNNSAAQSAAVTIVIDAAKTATVLTSSNIAAGFGDSVTLRAAVTSDVASLGGQVSFLDGANVVGTAALSANGIATFTTTTLGVGSHSLVAVYAGDTTHASSASAAVAQTVSVQTRASVISNDNPAIGGASLTLTAGVSASTTVTGLTVHPTGRVTFLDGATTLGTGTLSADGTATLTLSNLAVGTHSITVAYAGDGNFLASTSAALSQTIRSATTQIALTTSGSPSHYGNAVTLTAAVRGESVTPTGNVTFQDATGTLGQATLKNGTATLTVSTLSPGIHAITAAYAGDANNSASVSGTVTQQVTQTSQVMLTSSINPALSLDTPMLTATVKATTAPVPTGSVRFLEGNTLLGTGTLNASGVATITAPAFPVGTHVLTAQYGGDTAADASTSTALTLAVNLRATTTSLTSTAPSSANNNVVSLVSVVKGDGPVAPTGIVTFSNGNSTIGTSRIDASGVATMSISAATLSNMILTASYSGDTNYAASGSAEVQLPGTTANNFTLTVNPTALSVTSKKYVVAELTIQSMGGYSDTLSLGCLGLPYAATCTFEKQTVGLAADGLVKVKVTVDTGSPLTSGGATASNTQPMGKGPLLAMLPAGALFVWLLRGRRRVPALMMLLLLCTLIPVTGCGTLNQSSTPAGSYTFQVSASSPSGVTLSVPVKLTVTQ